VTLDIYAPVMGGDDEKAAKTTDDIDKKTVNEERKEEGKMNLTFAWESKPRLGPLNVRRPKSFVFWR
jgi:hypothetical protein